MKSICGHLFTALLISIVRCNIKILNTQDGQEHPEPCALTCSGLSRHDKLLHGWVSLSIHSRRVTLKTISIAGCGFVSPPVVTAAINNQLCAGIKTYWTGADRFAVVTFEETTADKMRSGKCDVSWIAVGYNC